MRKTFRQTVESEEQVRGGELTNGMPAEKAVGALCYLPKSIHILSLREAKERDTTIKRFFFESLLIGLEHQGVITHQQHEDALKLPNDYGWKGRKQ